MASADRRLEATRLVNDVEAAFLEEKFNAYEKAMMGGTKKRGVTVLSCQCVYIVILNVLILALAVGLLSSRLSNGSHQSLSKPQKSWSPVQDHVEYEERTVHVTDPGYKSLYAGPPSEEQEEAWDQLITPVYFNISRDELARAGESSENIIELTEGGYVASLAVYHELHCLRNLRLYVFRDRYYPNMTDSQHGLLKGHLDHCLEVLRLSIMCQGNTVVNSYRWDTETIDKPMTKSNSRSICADWSSIENWISTRKVSWVPPIRWPSQQQNKDS